MKKRSKLQVIYDILKAIQQQDGKIKPTHILYKSNLSHQMMDEYLEELISKDFIIRRDKGKSKTYSLTEKGHKYIERYKLIEEFTSSFGLDD
ncbi:MAG: winged helix-turn-helix domain-containing protein [Candidatus Woesearchaeota archaeon]